MPLLDRFDHYDGTPAAARLLEEGAVAYAAALAGAAPGDLGLVARAEAEVRRDPAAAIRFDATSAATVFAAGRRFRGGRFEVLRLCALRARALSARAAAGRPPCRVRLFVLDGASPLTDIGALQALAPPGTLFQVASQFNCLESPGRYVTDVSDYRHDPTQGPRAALSAFPGALVRHYAAPAPADVGGRFVQHTDGPQLDLLADVCDPGVARVRSGYLRAADITDPAAFRAALADRFESIAVGVHDDIEVVLGADWQGGVPGAPHTAVAQALTSTVAGGMYGGLPGADDSDDGDDEGAWAICGHLLRAAYLGTLLGAASLGKDRAVLTLIGGGVFGNPLRLIWRSILWAADQVAAHLHRDLTVLVNGRALSEHVPAAALAAAAADRGGALVRVHDRSLTVHTP